MITEVASFPLTKKWSPLCRSYAYRFKINELECLQEARLLEWCLSDKEFESDKHKENYFKKSLYHKLVKLVRISTSSVTSQKSHLVSFSYINEYKDREVLLKDETELLIDSVICLRPFDEIYYEELITHIAFLLSEMNILAANIFRDRMRLQIQWKEIKLQNYKSVPHNRYYQAVKMIKNVVKREVAYG